MHTKVTLMFLVIQCRSAFKGSLERSFLERLDADASTIHLKVAYHNEEGTPVTVCANLQEARRIRRIIHEDVLTS